jgi:hypothetical protein
MPGQIGTVGYPLDVKKPADNAVVGESTNLKTIDNES